MNPKKSLPTLENRQQSCVRVRMTLKEQSEEWRKRSLFERQWVIRDFKKTAGMSAEEWLDALNRLGKALQGDGDIVTPPLEKLAAYYAHQGELARGYEKDATKLEENLKHVYAWRDEVNELEMMLK